MTTREQARSAFSTQMEANQFMVGMVQSELDAQGCQTKAEHIAEVVAYDRANDPPELYWRFRFPEEVTVTADEVPASEPSDTAWKTDQRGWDEWRKRIGENLRGY